MLQKLSASCMVIMMLCASCSAPNGTQDSATMTPSVTPFVVETAVIPPTFTTMLTSTPTYAPLTNDVLAALCWVECRGMEEQRPNCCASVVDTVYTRIDARQMSDGTIFGTLNWGCTEDSETCQFPAYVVNGCSGINSPCPYDDPEGLAYFTDVVNSYSGGELVPYCANFLFYDLGLDTPECTIEAGNGQYVVFHGKWTPQVATPTPITGIPSIIEVTPLGGDYGWSYGKIESATGSYTPYNAQNVRWGPGIDYDRRYLLGAGQTVPFYAWVSSLPDEAWLCLDAPLSDAIGTLCTEAVAMMYNRIEYGRVVFDD